MKPSERLRRLLLKFIVVIAILGILIQAEHLMWLSQQPSTFVKGNLVEQRVFSLERTDYGINLNCHPASAFKKEGPDNEICDHPQETVYYSKYTVSVGNTVYTFTSLTYNNKEAVPSFPVGSCLSLELKADTVVSFKTCPPAP